MRRSGPGLGGSPGAACAGTRGDAFAGIAGCRRAVQPEASGSGPGGKSAGGESAGMNYKIARRLFNRPVMIHLVEPTDVLASIETASELRSWPYEDAAEDGIQVIPISGILANRYGYDRIRDWTNAAMRNEKVRGILLRGNSFGGEGGGGVCAAVDDNAFSAAYLLASQADRIYTTRTGGVGSVGVIAAHYDFSRWLNKEGITPTLITFGARQADFSPELPLSPEAREKIQGDVNRLRMQF